MVRPVIKKCCPKCDRVFFTKDTEMTFCSTTCEVKKKYNDQIGKITSHPHLKHCMVCGELNSRKVCSKKCESVLRREKTLKNNKELFLKSGEKYKNRKLLPYEVLNKIAEKRRVFDDDWCHYKHQRDRI